MKQYNNLITFPETFSEIAMPKDSRSVTIFDVAEAAGVSVTTVSRVLNNRDYVSDQTFQRVQSVINELGYSSSLAARSMRSRKTNVIGLIMPDVGDSFSIQVMKGINQAIVELDYDLLIYTSGDIFRNRSSITEQHYISLLNNSVTDGVILVTPVSGNYKTVSPVVAIDPHVDNPSGPAVISTNFLGAVEATQYLISLGHRRIGFIAGRPDLQSAHRRQEGFEYAIKEAGLDLDPQMLICGDFTTETAIKCARNLLSLSDPPTAIFASNDASAEGVITTAKSLGLSIPEDLSVIGFDNIPESELLNLTTVDQNIIRMGYVGACMLIDLIKGKELDEEVAKIKTKLILRDTCSSIR